GEDCDVLGGRKRKVALVERGRVLLGVPEELVGGAHGYLLWAWGSGGAETTKRKAAREGWRQSPPVPDFACSCTVMRVCASTPSMLAEDRRAAILERLRRDGKVVAAELSSSLDVSSDTVRRDLREMADAGLLRRVHGGALPAAVGALPYAARLEQAPAAKAA